MLRSRSALRCASDSTFTARPSNANAPDVGTSTHPRMCSNVDLPHPDGPRMARYSPAAISSDTPRKACTGPAAIGNVLTRSRATIILSLVLTPERSTRRSRRTQKRTRFYFAPFANSAFFLSPDHLVSEGRRDWQRRHQPHRKRRRHYGDDQQHRLPYQRPRLDTKKCSDAGICGIAFRIRSSHSARRKPSGSASTPPMPTSSADCQNTSAATRARENPSARSAAISPSRWFTETVSRTVIKRNPNSIVMVDNTAEI